MRALRAVLVTVLTVGLLTVAAYGAGFAMQHYGEGATAAEPTTTPPATPSPTTTPTPSETATATPTPAPKPGPVLERGDSGRKVRELQSRLFQLAWFPELTTAKFDADTQSAVRGFQAKRGFKATGDVDRRTWRRLVAMTDDPTHDQLFNILHPGPTLLAAGDSGADVRDLQARLVAIQWISGDVTGTYDDTTVAAVRGFQAKRAIPVTGEVDRRTLDRLHAMTSTPTHAAMHNLGNQPGALDARCLTGRVICIDKSTQTLRWVVDGKVQKTVDVRFGSSYTPTREGRFEIYRKSRDHVSSLYGSSMPFAMFFSGGQAVHYSSDFAASGYSGASHGCVNVRDYNGIAWLFDQTSIGDDVVIYWS